MAPRKKKGKRPQENKVIPDSVPEPENDTDMMEVVDAALLQINEEEEEQVTLSLSDSSDGEVFSYTFLSTITFTGVLPCTVSCNILPCFNSKVKSMLHMCNSKFNSNMPFFSHALVLVCVSDIQPPTTKENHQNQKLLIDIKALEEKVASLEEERDFLRETMKSMSSAGMSEVKTTNKRIQQDTHLYNLDYITFSHLADAIFQMTYNVRSTPGVQK